ncbi:MAG: hypothetical protein H7323_16580 [Frankiales bacterium]|nr:hypothetical protein [Frankiales bacterium]
MSPLDDELRAALHARADVLSPSPDPLAGIERRARRIRRNRTASALAGSVLAVAAIALAVPVLSPTAAPPPIGPAIAPSTVAPSSPYALDPAAPWAYRGETVPPGLLDTARRAFAVRHAVAEAAVSMSPLYGKTYEPSALFELVFVATIENNPTPRWGLVTSTPTGPDFAVDDDLPDPALALPAALPGDEVGRLLVVAAPQAASIDYSPDGSAAFTPMTRDAAGVAGLPLEGDPATDRFRVLAVGGDVITQAQAPDVRDRSGDGSQAGEPKNLLVSWPQRGVRSAGPPDDAVLQLFAKGITGTADPEAATHYRALFSGSTDTGVSYTFGQAWADGGQAYAVGLATGGTQGDQFFLGPITAAAPPVLVFVLCCAPGSTVETLVVVPTPGTGQVSYDDDGAGTFRPVPTDPALDGVVLIDREPRGQAEGLEILDGDGNLDKPTYRGPVFPLLCGLKGCG